MTPSKFDDLTKILATSTSRRQALRRLGGILGGTALAGVFPGLALASGGNSACAHFCNAVFGANTPAAGQCTSEAAHGKGLCSTCGSGTPASSICCTRNSSGFCSSYSGAHCPCESSQCLTCQNGACVSTCTSDQYCSNGTCLAFLGCSEGCSATLGLLCGPGLSCCPFGAINPPDAGLCCLAEDCNTVAVAGFCPSPGC
jgi:hypothetical protein